MSNQSEYFGHTAHTAARGQGWCTKSELEWLGRLQQLAPKTFENYKASFHKRKDWGNIDRRKVAGFLGITLPTMKTLKKAS